MFWGFYVLRFYVLSFLCFKFLFFDGSMFWSFYILDGSQNIFIPKDRPNRALSKKMIFGGSRYVGSVNSGNLSRIFVFVLSQKIFFFSSNFVFFFNSHIFLHFAFFYNYRCKLFFVTKIGHDMQFVILYKIYVFRIPYIIYNIFRQYHIFNSKYKKWITRYNMPSSKFLFI